MSMLTPYAPAPLPPAPPAHAPSPVDGQPLAQRPKSFFNGRFGLIFGLAAIILSVLAIVLASSGPFFVNHTAIPAGMTKVYDGTPNDSSAWRAADAGCSLVANGLDVTSNTREGCQFVPSENADLLTQGFYLSVTLAPDASVTNAQEPVVAITNDEYVAFDQAGAYIICTGVIDQFGNNTCVTAYSSAWHTDGYTPNMFSMVYQPGTDNGNDALVLFVNGQQARTVDLTVPGQSALVLAAAEPSQGQRGEAIYTHVTLYTAAAASQGS